MDKKDLKIAELPAHRLQESEREKWNGLIIIVTAKLAVLRMALGGIENLDHGDYDWLQDLTSNASLVDEADINERPEVPCLMDLTTEILEFAGNYSGPDRELNHVVGVLIEKVGLIRMALTGFRKNDEAIYLGNFVQELINYLDMHHFAGVGKDDVKEKIKSLIGQRDARNEYYWLANRAEKRQTNHCNRAA